MRGFFLSLALATVAGPAAAQSLGFDDQKAGEAPRGMTCALTGQGRAGAWVLRDAVAASLFDVALNGEALFRVEDRAFNEAGRVGVWTKADSVTCFDDLKVSVAK